MDPSRVGFLDLPREIRDLCYDFSMEVPGAIFIFSSINHLYRGVLKGRVTKYKDEGPPEPERVDKVVPMAFMRTCRQVHAESAEVLYGHNLFRLYMSNVDFAPSYLGLIRHVMFTMEAGRGIYSDDLEVMGYWWRRVFWPNIIERSISLLQRYPNLESLTFPIKSKELGQTWRPAFFAVEQKTRQQRIALAARWLKNNCPIRDERLLKVLRLEIQPSAGSSKMETKGSRFCLDDEYEDGWELSELKEAFDLMKGL